MAQINNDGGATRKFDTTDVVGASSGIKGTAVKGKKRRYSKKKLVSKLFSGVFSVILTAILVLIITGIIVGSAFAVYIKDNLIEDYDIVGLETNLEQTTKIFYTDKNGNQVEMPTERLHGNENRSWVSITKMPTNLKNAFVAIEDERFYEHNGMDFKRTSGAVLEFIKGNSSYGGSTITQQLIKNFSGDNEATIQRKITEIFRAISLTKKRSKDEVLEMYLNTINLSNGCYGVQAASNYLFGKDVSELTLVECASLASIPKSPYKYNPKSNPEENLKRRNTVLFKMKELGWISEKEYNEAVNAELVLNITNKNSKTGSTQVYSYFTDALIEQLITDLNTTYGYPREVAVNIIFNGGLEIHSTVDPDVQRIMEEVYKDDSTFPAVQGIAPESAMVVIDPFTGDVKGIVGGRGEKEQSRGLNRATMSKRQIGSAIKPLTVYGPAIDKGVINYATIIDDTPYSYNEVTEKYWPDNAGRDYLGKITVYDAVIRSLNTPAVKTVDMITPEYAYYFGKEKLGLTSLELSDCDYAPMALGGLTNGLTVLEVAGAYTTYANDGTYSKPRLYTAVYNNNGELLLEAKKQQSVVVSRSTSQLMTKILRGVVEDVYGTGYSLTLKDKVATAGKTGSTNSNKDFYFAGYTPYYAGAAWYGYDQPKYISSNTNYAMRAWDKVMNRIHDELVIKNLASGEGLVDFDDDLLVEAEFCSDSGCVPNIYCEVFDARGSRVETGWFKKGDEPKEECTAHVAVEFCPVSNGVAGPYCPKEGRKQFALVDVNDRDWYVKNIIIKDSEYTYRTINEFIPVTAPELPYFAGIIPAGMFAGKTKEDDKTPYPFNRACIIHNEPPVITEEPDISEETEESVETEEAGETGETEEIGEEEKVETEIVEIEFGEIAGGNADEESEEAEESDETDESNTADEA